MQHPTPKEVRAALDRGHVRLMGVFCDNCSATLEADFIAATQEQGLAAVRAWVAREHGWKITPGSDLCAECAAQI
jgi:hypothetical protein